MVLVDSSAWIESLRRNGDMRVKERAKLGEMFSVVPYRPSREEDWDRAVALAWRLRSRGLTVPWLNVLVAAIAIHDGVRLYAVDAHFKEIAGHTGLMLYRPGYGGRFNDTE